MFKLSVIICVYNEGESLIEALRSLYNNEIYPETEVIIVDDCSTNPVTQRILKLLAKFTRYKVIYSTSNLGLSNSRNLGFINATTDYILPLDADDVFPASTLDIVYETFSKNPDADFIVGNYYLINVQSGEKELIDCSTIATQNQIDINKLAIEWTLLGTSPCKKTTWESVGGYALKYSYSVQDVDFWIRVLKKGNKGFYLNEPVYTWYKSATGMNMTFKSLETTKLMAEHRDFYQLNYSPLFLSNKVFEEFYPYKQKNFLLPFGRKYFWQLKNINKIKFINFLVKSIFNLNHEVNSI
jgi:glycosyltransferase involved in cell wall biosynthesis